MARVWIIAGLLAAIAGWRPSEASMVVPVDLRYMAGAAPIIFAGTVSATAAEWAPRRTTIITRVTLGEVALVKGKLEGLSIELRMRGGKVGKDEIVTDDQPRFEVGRRYVIFCSSADLGSERNAYLPILGLYQGYFQIYADGRSGLPSVHDWAGRAVARVVDGHAVVVAEVGGGQMHGPQPTVVDVDVFRQGNQAARDSVMQVRAEREAPSEEDLPPQLRSRPNERSAPSGPGGAADSIRATQVPPPVVEVPIEVIRPDADPGTRLSEEAFLQEIRALLKQ